MLHGNTTSANAHYFRDMFKTPQSRATPQTDHEGYQVSIASTGDFDDHEQHPLVLDDGMDTPSAVRRTPEVYRNTAVTQRCREPLKRRRRPPQRSKTPIRRLPAARYMLPLVRKRKKGQDSSRRPSSAQQKKEDDDGDLLVTPETSEAEPEDEQLPMPSSRPGYLRPPAYSPAYLAAKGKGKTLQQAVKPPWRM
jgi:hypothetical protein